VLPTSCRGLFGRDPWKSADITAFGYILNIANGRTSWLAPTVGGVPADGAVLPYWIGAVFVKLSQGWLDPAFAARIPFALLLATALAMTWYAAYHLARAESAQPLPFAFGGEAAPVDYARAVADGALLALIACLGLLQLGHETTPELAQLAAGTLFLYGMSRSVQRPVAGGIFAALSLVALAAERRTQRRHAACGRRRGPRPALAGCRRLAPGRADRRRRCMRRGGGDGSRRLGQPAGRFLVGSAGWSAWCANSPGSPGRPGFSQHGRSGAGAGTCSAATLPCRSAAPGCSSPSGSAWPGMTEP
jgi:hypothetical protein